MVWDIFVKLSDFSSRAPCCNCTLWPVSENLLINPSAGSAKKSMTGFWNLTRIQPEVLQLLFREITLLWIIGYNNFSLAWANITAGRDKGVTLCIYGAIFMVFPVKSGSGLSLNAVMTSVLWELTGSIRSVMTLFPTFLLSLSDWQKLSPQTMSGSSNQLAFYFIYFILFV